MLSRGQTRTLLDVLLQHGDRHVLIDGLVDTLNAKGLYIVRDEIVARIQLEGDEEEGDVFATTDEIAAAWFGVTAPEEG